MINEKLNAACVPPTQVIEIKVVTSPKITEDLCLLGPKIDSSIAT